MGDRLVGEDEARGSPTGARVFVPVGRSSGLGRTPVKLLAWICAPFAWKVVRQHNGYTYLENTVTGRRSCRWDGNGWGHVDYSFLRSGDVSDGPFGRQVFD